VLASAAFAKACSEPLEALGTYTLPGIEQPAEVFTMAELRRPPREG
jgi:hypothetical protein